MFFIMKWKKSTCPTTQVEFDQQLPKNIRQRIEGFNFGDKHKSTDHSTWITWQKESDYLVTLFILGKSVL